jgi:hypothetical protein
MLQCHTMSIEIRTKTTEAEVCKSQMANNFGPLVT